MRFLNNNRNKQKGPNKCLNLHHKTSKQPKRNPSKESYKKKTRLAQAAQSVNSEIYLKQTKHIDQSYYLPNLYNQINKINMFYINSQIKNQSIKEKQLLDALIIPPEERPLAQYQKIYYFFANHSLLNEMQRKKSLNARIKCIASLALINHQQFDPHIHLSMHQFQDLRMIALPLQAKQKAEQFDQKIIRKRMDRLNVFSALKTLKYDGLLYLANNMEQFACKYKTYLYKEGDQPDYCFFIEEGEFQYSKNCEQKQRLNPIIKRYKDKNTSPPKIVQVKQQSPNKQTRGLVSRYQVGIVAGKLGQAIGLEQLILYQKARTYSVICNSTENKMIRIHHKYFDVLFSELPSFRNHVMQLVSTAQTAKNQLYNKIKITKSQLKQYIKNIQKEDKSIEKTNINNNKQLGDESNLKLPLVQKRSAISVDYRDHRPKGLSSALGSSNRDSYTLKSIKSQSNLEVSEHRYQDQQQYQSGFGLTAVYTELSPNRSKSNLQNVKEDPHENQAIELPTISKKSIINLDSKTQVFNQAIKHNQPKSRLHSYAGMIDSSQLVEEKQQILNRKIIKGLREDIFPTGHIELKQVRRTQTEDPMKLKASPAHSNRFMQKLLLKVLKKAGYDQVGSQAPEPTNAEYKVSNARAVMFKNQLYRGISKTNKRQQRRQSKKDQVLLVNSTFDDCYFNKI